MLSDLVLISHWNLKGGATAGDVFTKVLEPKGLKPDQLIVCSSIKEPTETCSFTQITKDHIVDELLPHLLGLWKKLVLKATK